MKKINREHKVRNFQQAKWDEPIIFELHNSGERGVLLPHVESEIVDCVGDGLSALPASLIRKSAPKLPEISQNRVLRHYLRLSQEMLGGALNVEIGQGTCTIKYSPKINEEIASSPKMTELHPLQDESTVQGILEITHKLDLCLKEISGMDYFSFQPGSGTQSLFTMASIVRAFHESNGEGDQRDEIITTIFSHPSQAATAAVKGYKIITLYPDKDGFPDLEKLKEVVSDRTAGFVVANPEDTGIYNTRIKEFTKVVHDAGGICYYDQANANGLLGITRAKEAGFDMCFFNLHKTFSTPHACGGPATGALGVVAKLKEFLPGPIVEKQGDQYTLKSDMKHSIGKVRSFQGVPQMIVRAYAWILAIGAEGLKDVAEIAVLNNNYLYHHILKIRGASAPYIKGQRLEQVRYSWEQLTRETGVTTDDISRRMADFAHQYWTSHHPYVVPEPFTLEPTESASKSDLDEYIASLTYIANEAYENPEKVKNAPYNSTIHRVDEQDFFENPEKWAITWRSYLKKSKEIEKIRS
ncbi:aminomethyl-transferring glycine dehydrogenase subunit GcvPB [Psychrobacillus sp. NEAU-3TGS]|uniref:aminomethyl-transferring glycine dehydrogenase subunit GcvPB n=1 Tax=Psychrobacillus sp. NEAU-3TGS TaxID=2995412 RepID=UPI002496670B|nr:aminomethyl-transferring glycine dehydrogenase subunit GcvPB [Psychrobacillus sp. NEAU-3TGS]MDI2588747.1 aminomethyl-transferring glycine dehydrogenase subunit GcvPB [Psychrobacillus sp. NEAU-3TGS]